MARRTYTPEEYQSQFVDFYNMGGIDVNVAAAAGEEEKKEGIFVVGTLGSKLDEDAKKKIKWISIENIERESQGKKSTWSVGTSETIKKEIKLFFSSFPSSIST